MHILNVEYFVFTYLKNLQNLITLIIVTQIAGRVRVHANKTPFNCWEINVTIN